MKLARTKNAIYGTIFGVLLRVYQIVCPFAIRTVFLYTLGVEYLGLDSLFTSIIQVLNIAELGVGAALVFSMYKPVADNDDKKICALLKMYRFYYRIIGTVVLIGGFALTPFLPKLIIGNIPSDLNLYVIYYLNLGAAVLSYWLFAYRNSLFNAHQKTDVISKVGIITNTFRYIFQITLLLVFKNYYMYLIIALFSQLLNNIFVAIASLKYYPNFHPVGSVDAKYKKEVNRTVKDLFYSKIGQVITNSFDTLVISSFLGLTTLAIYQNYYYIISSLVAIFTIFYKSCLAGIGNSLIIEDESKNFFDFRRITYIVCFILNFCVCCLLCLYPPFMKIWLRDDSLLLDYSYIVLLTAYFLVYELTMLLELYKDGAGNWHKDRFRPLIAAGVNLFVNIILVNLIGLYGIIISTIISYMFVNLPWIYKRLFEDVFSSSPSFDYIKRLIKYLVIIVLSSILSRMLCIFVPISSLSGQLIINIIFCTIISTFVFIVFTFRQSEFRSILKMVLKVIRKDNNK